MAANFWVSSHHMNWLRHSDQIALTARQTVVKDLALCTEDEIARTKVMHCRVISELAVKSNLRQRVAATAIVYFKRFYVRNCIKDHDPRLIAPVALYLAAKVEEHTFPAKVVIAHMSSLNPIEHPYPYTVSHVHDYEFKLIAALDFDLIIFHPYRPMAQYCTDANLTDLLPRAWPILNDSYLTDACLLYPPYLIAIACIFLAASLADRDVSQWIATLSVSTQDLADLAQLLGSMYTSSLLRQPTSSEPGEKILKKLHQHFAHHHQLGGAVAHSTPAGGASGTAAASVHGVLKRPPAGTKKAT